MVFIKKKICIIYIHEVCSRGFALGSLLNSVTSRISLNLFVGAIQKVELLEQTSYITIIFLKEIEKRENFVQKKNIISIFNNICHDIHIS